MHSGLQTILDGVWFVVVTMATVGYGDIEMQSFHGKLVAVATAICGVVLMALPISIIRCVGRRRACRVTAITCTQSVPCLVVAVTIGITIRVHSTKLCCVILCSY